MSRTPPGVAGQGSPYEKGTMRGGALGEAFPVLGLAT